ncbi:MAG: hypothetical protein V7703_16790 [Hyphomicrobiales bacterium]
MLICYEPASALDAPVQAQVLNLLMDMQARFGSTILFSSHNLDVVRQMSDDVTVLKSGRIVETGSSEDSFTNLQADYSCELLSFTPGIPGKYGFGEGARLGFWHLRVGPAQNRVLSRRQKQLMLRPDKDPESDEVMYHSFDAPSFTKGWNN